MESLNVDELLDRIATSIRRTSWRLELGDVPPETVARVCASRSLPADYRRFLSRVVALENREGDVVFVTARDLADASGEVSERFLAWRHAEDESVHDDAGERAKVGAFWDRVTPVVASLINGDDMIALDPTAGAGTIIEAFEDGGWSSTARSVSSTFTDFLRAFTIILAAGPAAFEYGWRLKRELLAEFRLLDPKSHATSVPLLGDSDFDLKAPPRKPTRPSMREIR